MDQTSDPETIHIVNNFEWPHGDIFLHHRVIRGGLLPAVVEWFTPSRRRVMVPTLQRLLWSLTRGRH